MHVLLTVDLKNATSEQREKFNNSLEQNVWVKTSLTTTWTRHFVGMMPNDEIATQIVKLHIDKASLDSRIFHYETAVAFSEEEPLIWST